MVGSLLPSCCADEAQAGGSYKDETANRRNALIAEAEMRLKDGLNAGKAGRLREASNARKARSPSA